MARGRRNLYCLLLTVRYPTERVGFEPTVLLRHTLSRRADSTALAPLQKGLLARSKFAQHKRFSATCNLPTLNSSDGEGGIRTHGTGWYNGFRDRPIQPLSHLSFGTCGKGSAPEFKETPCRLPLHKTGAPDLICLPSEVQLPADLFLLKKARSSSAHSAFSIPFTSETR